MDAEAKDRTLREVETLMAEHERTEATFNLVRLLAQRFKPDVDGCLAIVTFLLVVSAGITLAAILLEKSGIAIGVLVAIVAAFVVAAMAHRAWRRWNHKRFFRNVLLPEADARGVEIADLVFCLRSINSANEQLGANVCGLVKAVPLLQEVLADQGRDVQ